MSKPYILALASWFPDTDAPFHGIFNFHIIKALSKIAHVKVVYVKAQSKRLATENHRQTHIDGIDINYFYYKLFNIKYLLLQTYFYNKLRTSFTS